MDINVLIDKIKSHIGLQGQMNNIFDDTRIYDSILEKSLVEFNRYSGFTFTLDFSHVAKLWNPESVQDEQGWGTMYCKIPTHIMTRLDSLGVKIKTVREIQSPRIQNPYMSRGMRDDLLHIAASQIGRANYRKPSFSFRAPDTIVVKNMYIMNTYGMMHMIGLECTHPKNLCTITVGLEGQFEELCRYDIMINLYNNYLKNLKIDIGSVSLDLQLDEFQQAESNRKALLDQFKVKRAYENFELKLI